MPRPNFPLKQPSACCGVSTLGWVRNRESTEAAAGSRQNGDLDQAGGSGVGVLRPGHCGIWEGASPAWPTGGRISVAGEALPLRPAAPPLLSCPSPVFWACGPGLQPASVGGAQPQGRVSSLTSVLLWALAFYLPVCWFNQRRCRPVKEGCSLFTLLNITFILLY